MSELQNPQPFEALPTIEKQISIAINAATEQFNFLSRISLNNSLFTSVAMKEVTLKYQNQINHMRAIRQQCEYWLDTEALLKPEKTAIYQLEINSFKLQRLSEEIIDRLNKFPAKLETESI